MSQHQSHVYRSSRAAKTPGKAAHRFLAAATIVMIGSAQISLLQAANLEKANNNTALNNPASYVGSPTINPGDIILVDSTMTAGQNASLGANLSVDGIVVDATATQTLTVAATGGFTLTLGASGISLLPTGGPNLNINSLIALSANQTWAAGNRSLTLGGASTITDNGFTLAITGANLLNLSSTASQSIGANIGVNGIVINGGATLTLTNTGNTFGAAAINANSTLSVSSLITTGGTSSAAGKGALTLGGSGSTGTVLYTGNTASASQGFQHDARSNMSRVDVTTAGQTLTLTSNLGTTNIANSTVGNGWTFGGAGNLTINSIISDSANATRTGTTVTKVDAGTLRLSGVNTYTGATTAAVGTLLVNGSTNALSAVTVNTGATLGGTGTINGTVTVNGALAPGDGLGALTVANDVTWNGLSGQDWKFELGVVSGSNDKLVLTGAGNDFLKGTGTDFRFDLAGTGVAGTFTLVDWANTATTNFASSDFTYTNLGAGLSGLFSVNGSQLDLVVTAVPEPSTWALLAGGSVLLAMVGRQRKARS